MPIKDAIVVVGFHDKRPETQAADIPDVLRQLYKTDANGEYRIPPLPPGSFDVRVWFDRPEDKWFCGPQNVRIASTSDEHAVDFVAIRGATVIGKVTDRFTGQPLHGMHVYAKAANSREESETTDESGEYTLRLAPGHYRVGTERSMRELELPENGGHEIVAENDKTYLFDFFEPPKAVDADARPLIGKVLDMSGKPVNQAVLTLFRDADGDRQIGCRAMSESDGSFRFPAVFGAWRLRGFAVDAQAATAVPIDVAAGQDIVVHLQPWPTVKGRVVDAGGRPIAGATVNVAVEELKGISSTTALVRPSTTDADGNYTMPVRYAAVRYRLWVNHPKQDESSQRPPFLFMSEPRFRAGRTVVNHISDSFDALSPGVNRTAPETVLKPADQLLGGRAIDFHGNPIFGAAVHLEGPEMMGREAYTDSCGKFRFDHIADGDYLMVATIDQWARGTLQVKAGTQDNVITIFPIPPRRQGGEGHE